MIQGFPDQSSAFPGDSIPLRVSTDAPWFRIDAYRQGTSLKLVSSSPWLAGDFAPDHRSEDDWGRDGVGPDGNFAKGWMAYPYDLPSAWVTGVYILMFVEGDEAKNPKLPMPDPMTPDARTGKAMIVVKNPNPGVVSQLLYKVPLFTYHAYNAAGGNSIYQQHNVHFHRPGGGTGGTPWDMFYTDTFDGSSPRQVFAHWDAPFIRWLELSGYRVDYCTDLDIHRDGIELLSKYALVLSVGHDEYYSEAMRAALESFRDAGGNIAFCSGNTSWWRAEFDPNDPLLMLGQQTIQNWSSIAIAKPEDLLTGVSFRNGGWGQSRSNVGYSVQHTEQWPFEETGLTDGDAIGVKDGIIGYECDGAPCNVVAPGPIAPSFNDPTVGTPAGFMILGTGDTSSFNEPLGNHIATMGMYTQTGTIFTAATTDWPRVATIERDVGRITKNVIDRLGGRPKGLATLANIPGIVTCDGFYTPDDEYRHAILGMGNGDIVEIFFNPWVGQGQTVVANVPGLRDIAGFWSSDDRRRHIIAADTNGVIWDVYFHPSTGIAKTKIADMAGAIRVAGFYSYDDHFRHAIVATDRNVVFEISFQPDHGSGLTGLGTFADIVDISSFYSPDDQCRHVIVAQGEGTIYEVYFDRSLGIAKAVLGSVPGAKRVAAYYAADDAFFNRRVVVATDRALFEFRYHPNFGIQRVQLIHLPFVDLGAFFTDDDGFRHAVVISSSGDVRELFFRP